MNPSKNSQNQSCNLTAILAGLTITFSTPIIVKGLSHRNNSSVRDCWMKIHFVWPKISDDKHFNVE